MITRLPDHPTRCEGVAWDKLATTVCLADDNAQGMYMQAKEALANIDKNLEKQEENRGQELVDAEGKQVDIMDDLIRLEGEMHQYIKDIDQIQEEIGTLLHFQQ